MQMQMSWMFHNRCCLPGGCRKTFYCSIHSASPTPKRGINNYATIWNPWAFSILTCVERVRLRYNRTQTAIYHIRMTHPKLESILFTNSKQPPMSHASALSNRILLKWSYRWIRGFYAFFYKFNGKFNVHNVISVQSRQLQSWQSNGG